MLRGIGIVFSLFLFFGIFAAMFEGASVGTVIMLLGTTIFAIAIAVLIADS